MIDESAPPVLLGPLSMTSVFFHASHDRMIVGIGGMPPGVVVDGVVLGTQHVIATPGTFIPLEDCFYFEPRKQPAGLALLVWLRNTTAAPIECALRLRMLASEET